MAALELSMRIKSLMCWWGAADHRDDAGGREAPWEAPATAPALLKKLGYFRKPVLALLDRDPLERPSMAEFHQACRHVLAHTTAS